MQKITKLMTPALYSVMVLFKINVLRNIATDEKILTCNNHGLGIFIFRNIIDVTRGIGLLLFFRFLYMVFLRMPQTFEIFDCI